VPIKKCWQVISLGSAIALMGFASPAFAVTAQTPPPVAPLDEATCAHPELSQPLLGFGDSNLYSLAPDGAFDNGGAGWQLANGATINQTVQPDGSFGGVLDLPGKSQATSPPMCITVDYPTARLWSRNITGTDGVSFNVQYWDKDKGEWTKPKDNGGMKGEKQNWTLSNDMPIKPDPKNLGWQQVRFTLIAGGDPKKRFQVDNFWVDPRASR
jgi:hypothetical protein